MTGEQDADGPGKAHGVPQDELARSFTLPAQVSNRILATNTPSGMRLAFAEAHGEKVAPVFRAAIFLSYDDAEALRDLIERQLALLRKVEIEVGEDGKPIVRR